jgi:hypothetical protein
LVQSLFVKFGANCIGHIYLTIVFGAIIQSLFVRSSLFIGSLWLCACPLSVPVVFGTRVCSLGTLSSFLRAIFGHISSTPLVFFGTLFLCLSVDYSINSRVRTVRRTF